jgi:hypothetical protein
MVYVIRRDVEVKQPMIVNWPGCAADSSITKGDESSSTPKTSHISGADRPGMLNFIVEADSGVLIGGVFGNGRTYGHGIPKIASAF